MRAIAVLCLVAVASALPESHYQSMFSKWVGEHSKSYDISEFFTRYNIFKSNVDYINHHNAQNSSLVLGLTQFVDLTAEEFAAYSTGLLAEGAVSAVSNEVPRAPPQIDWSKKGAVNTRVKNQGSCGSCWAFSATGSLEGAWQIKNGELLDISEQQLVDCSGSAGNQGCNGGLMTNAFKWYQTNGGACSQTAYPYTARQGTCKAGQTSVAKITGFVALKADENALGDALQLGPVSIAVAASSQAFQMYKSGIVETGCGTQLNHGVLLVGYTPDSSTGYWIVKNSWGQTWGNQGYIWLRAFKNTCGVSNTLNTYPNADKKQ